MRHVLLKFLINLKDYFHILPIPLKLSTHDGKLEKGLECGFFIEVVPFVQLDCVESCRPAEKIRGKVRKTFSCILAQLFILELYNIMYKVYMHEIFYANLCLQ
jgi:hypothetical protein